MGCGASAGADVAGDAAKPAAHTGEPAAVATGASAAAEDAPAVPLVKRKVTIAHAANVTANSTAEKNATAARSSGGETFRSVGESATEFSNEGGMSDGRNGVLTRKLAEAHVKEDEDTEEWALTRLQTLCRLSPLRLARHVMELKQGTEKDAVIDKETFFDKATCAVLFLDYSRICQLTTAMFKRQGIFVRPKSLASTLNKHLGAMCDMLTRGGGDIIKFAGDAVLVAFAVTEEAGLAEQTLRATQLSMKCIEDLQGVGTVEGIDLTAHAGIGVGDVTGFLVGGAISY